jgi:predicted ArsR family transcriptional regulator
MILDNSDDATSDRILGWIKRRGPMTTRELADAVAVTVEAARQQMARLVALELVRAEGGLSRGPGRPAQAWALTPAAAARFPDTHAELAVALIDTVRAELGAAALEQIVLARERRARDLYLAAMKGARTVAARVSRLAAIRSREGYMAEWRREGGGFLLMENHCPICAAAKACQGFCRAELELFQEVLGPGVRIVRTDHIIAGARRCAYRIEPQTPATS